METQKHYSPNQENLDSEKSSQELTSHQRKQDNQNQQEKKNKYTAGENQFADGKGTQLNAQITPEYKEVSDELSQQVEGTFEDQEFGEDQPADQLKPSSR